LKTIAPVAYQHFFLQRERTTAGGAQDRLFHNDAAGTNPEIRSAFRREDGPVQDSRARTEPNRTG
jgi:hypothetical protein